ncbi:hypothetical protein [Bacillus toyonensis]|uniref:hypothetical protein n=1 Tax=Bacillus toyonensis TaxID=155322 RepID=UPI003D19CCEA
MNDLLVWSTSAPISTSLKLELQDAINAVKIQLDANPFSCCDTIKTLQTFVFVLLQVINQPLVGSPFKVNLQNLVQQLQVLFAGYIACLACEPGPTGPTQAFSNTAPIVIPGTGTVGIANPYPSQIVVNGMLGVISKITVILKNIISTFPDDIGVLLVGPQGQALILM